MGNVGLLFVGAVLFLNGVMLLGWVEAKSAAPINFFVGVLQVVTPTYLIFTANGDANVILAAAFCAFVAVCAHVYAGLNFIRFQDNGFGVIWLYWAFLWALFFLVLGLKRDGLTRYTGIDRQRRAGRQLELTVMTSADNGLPRLVVSLGTAHQLIA